MPTLPAASDVIQRFRADHLVHDGSGNVTTWTDMASGHHDAVPWDTPPTLIANDADFANFPSVDFRRTTISDPSRMLKASAATVGLDHATWGVVYSMDWDFATPLSPTARYCPFGMEYMAGGGNIDDAILYLPNGAGGYYNYGDMWCGNASSGSAGADFFGPNLNASVGKHRALIVSATGNGNTTWHLDGVATPASSSGGRSHDLDCLTLGGLHSGLHVIQGRIAELIVWGRDLTSGEQAQFDTYVHDRYVSGIPDVPPVAGSVIAARECVSARVTRETVAVRGVSAYRSSVRAQVVGAPFVHPSE